MSEDIISKELADEIHIVKDPDGRIESFQNLDYHQAMAVVCVKCGKQLTFNPDEDLVEEADCCGITYRLYAQKYDIEIDRTCEDDDAE